MLLREYCPNRTLAECLEMIAAWDTLEYEGKYFEMVAVLVDGEVVGSVSLYDHGEDTIGPGPEIWQSARQKGYACAAMTQALAHAKAKGFTKAEGMVRIDNAASIRLHEKLGYICKETVVNRKGNTVHLFEKLL